MACEGLHVAGRDNVKNGFAAEKKKQIKKELKNAFSRRPSPETAILLGFKGVGIMKCIPR